MISVLIPSRGRHAALAGSITSLKETASGRVPLEFLVAADPDDKDTILAVSLWSGTSLWVAPQRFGYNGLHEYYNALAAQATGDWLLIWNDDALMRTQGWDQIVESQDQGVLWPSANHHEANNLFPIWPAAWTRAIGHVSLCFNCDTWMQEVGAALGRQWKIPVTIYHDRHNVTGSPAFDDTTAAEGTEQADKHQQVLNSPEMLAARGADMARIAALL
jgi:glycosyl transferase / beta-hydroxylase protein BlmF